MLEGRSPDKVEKMIVAVSEAVATSLETPIEGVRVIVHEMQDHQYGAGGKPFRVLRAEREAAE